MGLENDRRMMVVTPEGEFLTQREFPKLALVTPMLKENTITLSAPDFDSIQFIVQKTGTALPVNIWKSKGVQAVDQGEEAAESTYSVSQDDHTGFADGYPILIVSEESLEDLNSRIDMPIPMNRFRPNLVVKGCDPFAEDTWKRIQIGDVELAIVKPCPRCVVTTIDKQTLEQSKEPLKTLNTFRKRVGGVMFGQNAIPLNEGRIEVGMNVKFSKKT
jgi:uncharacterized protein YcbX